MDEKAAASEMVSRRRFIKASLRGAAAAGVVFSVGTSDALDVRRIACPIRGLAEAFDGFRVAFASDFHFGSHVATEKIVSVVGETNAFCPDIILLGGDYAGESEDDYARLTAELLQLSAPLGIHAVPGNHEYWENIEKYRKWIARTPINDLTNAGFGIERGGENLWVAGLDDEWGGWPEAGAAVEGAPEGAPRIVFTHNPELADKLPDGFADLILAGHTHGWQIYVPLLTKLLLPNGLATKYRAGFYPTKAGMLYVSRGVGAIYPIFRLWCRPELTLITLKTT